MNTNYGNSRNYSRITFSKIYTTNAMNISIWALIYYKVKITSLKGINILKVKISSIFNWLSQEALYILGEVLRGRGE